MYGPLLAERDHERRLILRHGGALSVAEREDLLPLRELELTYIVEALAQQLLGRLVEEQQVAALVGEEHRNREPGRELAHQDESDIALRHYLRIVTGPMLTLNA
jgi:hypothetical protein